MKDILIVTFLLIFDITHGKPASENNEVGLPKINKLNFDLEDIVSKNDLEAVAKALNNIQNDPQVNGILNIEINLLVDGLLENLKDIIIQNGMDPLELEDSTLSLFPIGSISLTSGWLQDISSIRRDEDVVISYHTSTRKVTFLLPLSFKALLFTYKYHTRVTLLSIKGDVQGKIDDMKLNIELTYDPNIQTFTLGQLSLRNSGKITVKFTGNGLVDWLTNAMTSVVTTVLHPILIRIVESFVKSAGNDLVNAVNDYLHSIFGL